MLPSTSSLELSALGLLSLLKLCKKIKVYGLVDGLKTSSLQRFS